MDKESLSLIMEKLEALANKLGVTAEYIFGVYIQQAHVEVVRLYPLFITAFIVFCVTGYLWGVAKNADWEMPNIKNVSACIFSIASLGLLVATIVNICSTLIPCLLNPEYYAMSKLLSQIK